MWQPRGWIPCLRLHNPVCQPHVVKVSQRAGRATVVHMRGLEHSLVNPKWHGLSSPSPWSWSEATDTTCAPKSDLLSNTIPANPLHVLFISLLHKIRQNSWSAYLCQTWEHKVLIPHCCGLMSETGLLLVCCCIQGTKDTRLVTSLWYNLSQTTIRSQKTALKRFKVAREGATRHNTCLNNRHI